jgi:hypothetical protein
MVRLALRLGLAVIDARQRLRATGVADGALSSRREAAARPALHLPPAGQLGAQRIRRTLALGFADLPRPVGRAQPCATISWNAARTSGRNSASSSQRSGLETSSSVGMTL